MNISILSFTELLLPFYACLRPNKAIAKWEKMLKSRDERDQQSARSLLISAYLDADRPIDAKRMYLEAKANISVVQFTEGGDAFVLARLACYEKDVLKHTQIAKKRAQDACDIAHDKLSERDSSLLLTALSSKFPELESYVS